MQFSDGSWIETSLPPPHRLVAILSCASTVQNQHGISLMQSALYAILRIGLSNQVFWREIEADSTFRQTIQSTILSDDRPLVRSIVGKIIQDIVLMESQRDATFVSSDPQAQRPGGGRLASFFFECLTGLLPAAAQSSRTCHGLFATLQWLTVHVSQAKLVGFSAAALAGNISRLLLSHTSTEVRMDSANQVILANSEADHRAS
jgi:hypothetical protein